MAVGADSFTLVLSGVTYGGGNSITKSDTIFSGSSCSYDAGTGYYVVVDETGNAMLYASYGTDGTGEYIVLNFDFTATGYLLQTAFRAR